MRRSDNMDEKRAPVAHEGKRLERQRTYAQPARVTNLNLLPMQARMGRLREMGQSLFPADL